MNYRITPQRKEKQAKLPGTPVYLRVHQVLHSLCLRPARLFVWSRDLDNDKGDVSQGGCCRGNAAVLFIIYKDCFVGICICRQCAINSIRSGVGARRRRTLHNVCDTFDRS